MLLRSDILGGMQVRKPYPMDVSEEEPALIAPYLNLD